MTRQLRNLLFASLAIVLAVACSKPSTPAVGGTPIVLGYSNWAGWWPWAIAERTTGASAIHSPALATA